MAQKHTKSGEKMAATEPTVGVPGEKTEKIRPGKKMGRCLKGQGQHAILKKGFAGTGGHHEKK